MHHVGRVALMIVAGCSVGTGTPPSTASAAPAVHRAWIAYELVAQHIATASTTFVAMNRPATPPLGASSTTFIVARDATFDVIELGRHTPALALTTFNADNTACVGRGERSVALKFEKPTTGPAIEEALVLEGCAPPPNTYAVVVVEGAHPSAVLVTSAKGRVVRLPSGVELPVPE